MSGVRLPLSSVYASFCKPADGTTKIIHALTLTAILGTVLAKLVLCIFYYRLSPARWYRYGILLTAFLCVACSGSVWLAVMFACRPIAAAWDLRLLHTGGGGGAGRCIPRPPWYLLQAIAGGVTDLLLMLQPMPTVLGLQISAGRKAALLAWFGLGTVTLAAAIMRLLSLLSMTADPDTPWTMADAMLWLVVESNLIVLCGCLPTFRDFVLHVMSKLGRSDESKGSGHNSNSSNNNNNNRKYRVSGNSSSNQESHKMHTFGAGSTRQEFDTIAEIEFEFGGRFRPTNSYHHQAQSSTTAAAGVGTSVETGNDTTCLFAGDAASPRENGSEVYVLMRHTSTRELML
ncbi:hypothetical protein PG985_000914 [Apiospora marii]|uniref:uncharacterized protein n=1 Tax=Apiospora marii TaxID=335849 RepID=UPI00312D5FC0